MSKMLKNVIKWNKKKVLKRFKDVKKGYRSKTLGNV